MNTTILALDLGTTTGWALHHFDVMTIVNYAKLGPAPPDAETAARSFDKILIAANRAARITNGILGFARNRPPGYEPTDMVKLIDDTLLLLEREMVKYRVKIERRILEAPPALANTNHIQQVLLNLLINARQVMPQGGVILVQLSHDPPDRHGRPLRCATTAPASRRKRCGTSSSRSIRPRAGPPLRARGGPAPCLPSDSGLRFTIQA